MAESVAANIVWLDRYDRASHRDSVGAKNASLGEMTMAGLAVPLGFAVTSNAYRDLWNDSELADDVAEMLGGIDRVDLAGNEVVSAGVRHRIEMVPVANQVATDIAEAYERLCQRCAVAEVAVAVRSSATAEDLPGASFAGQHDSFLWVSSAASVVAHVRRCWASVFTARAIAYRQSMGYDHESMAMSVAVQQVIDPTAAGVAFTLNPINGDRSQIAVEASWGLGEAVVSGEVTPDHFLVDKGSREVLRRQISDKQIEYRLSDGGSAEKVEIVGERRREPSVGDEELARIVALALQAEEHFACPQDIEWAIDPGYPEETSRVVMLQSRPETVWSAKAKLPDVAANQGALVNQEVVADLAVLAGMAASPGVAEGLARVVLVPENIADVQEGEILVAPMTAPSWAPVFSMIAACVTDVGGMMSHAAILCREFGLPAVTGIGFGTTEIKTGDRLRVDGSAGTVTTIG